MLWKCSKSRFEKDTASRTLRCDTTNIFLLYQCIFKTMNYEWLARLQIQKNCALVKWPPAIVVVSRKTPDRRRFVTKFDLTYLLLMCICWSHNPTICSTMNHPPLPSPIRYWSVVKGCCRVYVLSLFIPRHC